MIGYLGPQGTFSHLAALEYFGENAQISPYPSIYSLIMAVDRGELENAILPIENTIEGSVTTTIDTLVYDASLYIIGEHILKIRENLMARPGVCESDVTKILSHPQPIAQCSRMLEQDFRGVAIVSTESTAAAAKIVASSSEPYAVLGPRALASCYGLELLREDCADDQSNATRFVIVSKTPSSTVSNSDKTSIAFTLDHRPGSLWGALEMFAKQSINMLKIESRPLRGKPGKYVFIIDIDGNSDDASIFFALEKIRSHTDFYKFLGSYRKG